MGGDAEAGVTHDDGVCGATVHGFPTEAEFLARLDVGASGIDGGGVDERELVGRDVVFLGWWMGGCRVSLSCVVFGRVKRRGTYR